MRIEPQRHRDTEKKIAEEISHGLNTDRRTWQSPFSLIRVPSVADFSPEFSGLFFSVSLCLCGSNPVWRLTMKNAVVLLSGGLDSSTVLALARRDGFEVYALTIHYGQRHNEELAAAARVA